MHPTASGQALVERRKVLHAAAAVALLFAITDYTILHRVSFVALGVRAVWALVLAGGGALLPRLGPTGIRRVVTVMAVTSSVCFALLVELTGGPASPMFHWVLAVPLTVAVVIQDYAQATLASGLATVASGIAILLGAHQAATAIPWAIQAAGMSGLAYYASVVYERLRAREAELERIRREALERTMLLQEERSARHRAEEAVAARDAFLSVASHELKTPLTILRLQLQRLVRTPGDLVLVRRADEQAKRLGRLVEDLLDASLLTAGRLELRYENLDLGALVKELADSLATAACPIVVQVEAGVIGEWDRARLEQIVLNLLGNALKYGGGLPIRVGVRASPEVATLEVVDQGGGIPLEEQVRIFGRFERSPSQKDIVGHGIGLWVVARTADALGGRVLVRSEPGKGSTFCVELPRQRPLRSGSRAKSPDDSADDDSWESARASAQREREE